VGRAFLNKGNGHQTANRRKALSFTAQRLPDLKVIDERTARFEPYGLCHFAAYTHPDGAMVSTPGRDDNEFGAADWHKRDRIMMFRDFGDGRVAIFVCPIKPLFDKRSIGHHGVRWKDVLTLAEMKQVFRVD
jgi:hypothetical protein